MSALMAQAEAEGREALRASEARTYDGHEDELRRLDALLRSVEASDEHQAEGRAHMAAQRGGLVGQERGDLSADRIGYRASVPLTRGQSVFGYAKARGLVPEGQEGLSLGKFVRGFVTGSWDDADAERRAMAEGALATGGVIVPTPLSTAIIDRARAEAAVFRAGARTVAMDSKTLTLPRLVTDPTLAWHTENAVISPSDPTLEAVQLKAQTLAGLVTLSRELVEDTDVDAELRRIFGDVFATKIDQVALYGTGTAPEPRGVRNTAGISTVSMGANGAALTNYDPFVDAVGVLADNNHSANAAILSPRSARALGKLKDSTNQPLSLPPYIDGLIEDALESPPLSGAQPGPALAAHPRRLVVGAIRSGRT